MADSKAQEGGSPIQNDVDSKKQSTEFLSLNDFCCLEIFKYLPLNDVCALSQTCRRLHALGTNHFTHNYKSKVLVYIDRIRGSLHTFPDTKDAKYAKCFAEQIQNVTLLKHFSTIQAMEKLSQIYQCGNDEQSANDSPIKMIRFLDWKVAVSKAHCTPIAGILKNVESLTIENTSIGVDLNECLFDFMPKLKQLTVLCFPERRRTDFVPNTACLQQPCSSLEYFAWHVAPDQWRVDEQFPAKEIKQFLTLSSGVKFISLRLDSKEQLKAMMASDIPVNELFFVMSNCEDADITGIIDDLKTVCESRKLEPTQLHLQINGHSFEEKPGQLELLAPYIVGLYFQSFVLKCFETVFPKLIKLKVLQAIEYVPDIELVRLLPNLEEIYIPCLARPFSYYEDGIRTLATGLPKLKKLFLNHYLHPSLSNMLNYGSDFFDEENFGIFDEIDAERKKMSGVRKLKVYLEVEHNLNKVKTEYDTIGIERSQTEAITNPLIQPTHLANTVAAPDGCVIQ